MDGNKRSNPRPGDTRNENDNKETKMFTSYKEINLLETSSINKSERYEPYKSSPSSTKIYVNSSYYGKMTSSSPSYMHPTQSSARKVRWSDSGEAKPKAFSTEICDCFNPEHFGKKSNTLMEIDSGPNIGTTFVKNSDISYDCLSTIADNIKDNEVQQLGRSLGFSDTNVEEIIQSQWTTTTFATVYHMLCWWKNKDVTLATKKNLIEALLAINRRKLVEEIFPDFQEYKLEIKFPPISSSTETMTTKDADLFSQDVIKLLASNLKTYEFYRLCKELHLTEPEMQNLMKIDWRNNSQERVSQMLNVWFQMTANKDRKTILVRALNSIHRNDLAKEIHQGNVQISTSKENKFVSTEHKEQRFTLEKEKDFISEDIINCLADSLERWQIISLSRNLGLREKEIDKIRETNLMKNKKEGISQMLKTWKEFSSKPYTKQDLFEALTLIQQEKLAKKLFPGIDQRSPKIDSNKNTTVMSKTVIKDDKDFQDVIDRVASTISEDDSLKLFMSLGLNDREIKEASKINWIDSIENKYIYLFKKWKKKFPLTATKYSLICALQYIKRSDLLIESKTFGNDVKNTHDNKTNGTDHDESNRIISHLANTIREDDAYVLFKKLGIQDSTVDDVMNQSWLTGFQKKFCTLLQQWRSNYKNDDEWKIDLMSILCSIDRLNLVKEIFPNLMTRHTDLEEKLNKASKIALPEDVDTRKITLDEASQPSLTRDSQSQSSSTDSDYKTISLLSNKIGETDAQNLLKKLEISDFKIEMAMNCQWLSGFPRKCCYLLQQWKENLEKNIDWKYKLAEALYSIHRIDLIVEFFPDLKPIGKEVKKQRSEDDQIVLAEGYKTNDTLRADVRVETVSADTLKRIASKLNVDEALNLCRILGYENKIETDSKNTPQTENFHLLMKWKLKSENSATDTNLFHALVSIKREDLAKELFPSVYSKVYTTEKERVHSIEEQSSILRKVSENITEEEAAKLFKKLEIKEEEIKEEKRLKWFESEDRIYYSVLQTWWVNAENTLWESILATALVSINRLDLAKKLFPFHDYTTVSPPQNKEINEASVTSSPEHISGTATEREVISEQRLRKLSYKFSEKQSSILYRKLGLEPEEVKDVMKEYSYKPHPERVYQALMKWKQKQKSATFAADEILERALLSIERKDLINEIFPELKTLKELANRLTKKDANAIFKKLGITNEKMQDEGKRVWFWDTPNKYQLLRKWWQKINKNVWDYILTEALRSVNRQDLIKTLFPEMMRNEKEASKQPAITDKAFRLLKYVTENLSEYEFPFLFQELGITQEKVIAIKKVHVNDNLQTKYYFVLINWKEEMKDDNSWDSILAQALASINRQDLIRELFPVLESPSTKNMENQICPMDVSTEEQEPLSELISKIGEEQGPFLFSNLKEITDEEVKRTIDQPGYWKTKYSAFLQNWKEKISHLDWKFEVVQALVTISRMDVIEDFFPEYVKHPSEKKPIQNEKERAVFSQLISTIGEDKGLFLFLNLNGITNDDIAKEMDQSGEWQSKYCNLLQKWKEKMPHLDWKFELVLALVAIECQDVIKDLFPDYIKQSTGNEVMPSQRKSIQDEIKRENNFDQSSHYHNGSKLTNKTLRREDYEKKAMDEFQRRIKLLKEKKEEKCPSEKESDSEDENLFWTPPMEGKLRNIQDHLKCSYFCFQLPKTFWSKNLKVGIKEAYVPLDLLHKSYNDSKEIELEDLFSKQHEDTNRILVESHPGFGKTILCHKIAYDWSNNEAYLQIFAVVFVLFLRHFTGNLEEMLIDECNVKSSSKDKILDLITKLEERILLILDGFDELSEKSKENLVPLLTGEKYPKMTVLVTSRMGCFKPFCTDRTDSVQVGFSMRNQQNLENMNFWQSIIEIKGVSKVNSELLLKNYFGKDAEMYLGMISLMLSEDLKTFEKSPFVLLLTTIIIQVKDHKSITSLTEIFKHVLKIAIKRRLVEDSNFDKKTKLTLFASNNDDPLFQVMVKFGKFAFRMLSTDTFTYKEDDLIKKVDKKFFLSLGILMENVILSDGKKINVLEPVNKLFMEFFAAFYFSTSLTDYYEGSGRMKNSLITLMSNFIINRKHLLFLPFVGGFLQERMFSFLERLSPCSSILSPFDFPLFDMICESRCINKLLPSIQSFVPPVYNYASSQFMNKNKELTKNILIQDGIKRNQIKLMQLNPFSLEDLPKISDAKIVTLPLDEPSVEERPLYQKSNPKNLKISCNNLVILLGNMQSDKWDDYVQVVRSIYANKLHICLKPSFFFDNFSNCFMKLLDEKDIWKEFNNCSLNLSVNVSMEQQNILKYLQHLVGEELNLEEIHLNLIYHSKSLQNMILGIQMNVDNSINFLLCLNNSLDVLEDQIFMCLQEAAEFLLMCLEDCFRELKCFDHRIAQLKENFQDDSFISELQSFIADKLQKKFINVHSSIIDIIESVKSDKHLFFRNTCEMAQVLVFLQRHMDSILSELSKLIDEIKTKHSNLQALLNVLENKEESVKNMSEELQNFCITLSNSSIDYLSISNSKQSKLFPLHMDLLCQWGKKKWKRIHVRNNIKLEFNETRFPKFHISNLELDGERVVFATNDVRTILQCESLDSLVCSSLALEMLLRQPIERDWNGFETLQRIRINMNETRFSQIGFSSLKPFRKLKHLTLNFENVSYGLNYQKYFVDAISLHSLKILEFQNAFFVEFSFLRDFMKELIETHTQKKTHSQNYRPLLYLEELKIDFPHLRDDKCLKELFSLVDNLFKTNIIEIFTFVTSESNVCKFILSEVLARDNWKMKKDICIEDDRLCEVSELYWQSKNIPQVFSITKG